jgi:hypothetical protein
VLFGPAPEWKSLAFGAFILAAAFVLPLARSRQKQQFHYAVLLAVIAVLFVLVIYIFR